MLMRRIRSLQSMGGIIRTEQLAERRKAEGCGRKSRLYHQCAHRVLVVEQMEVEKQQAPRFWAEVDVPCRYQT